MYTPNKLDSSSESDSSKSPEENPRFWSTRYNNTECILYRMADQSEEESDSGTEEINGNGTELREKIRKLEQQKLKLEKRNSERSILEKKYKELERSVKSLKSSASSGYGSGSPSQSVDKNRGGPSRSIGPDFSSLLNDQKARLSKVTRGRTEAQSSEDDCSDEEDDNSEDEDKDKQNSSHGEKCMSKELKQKLQDNRHTLVENMMADDIFNDLIAKKVLTTADVGRIKEKNTRESINEELLDNLVRRSDRAFHEFVSALRKTLQGYLADLLDEPPEKPKAKSVKKKRKRKRQAGEMNVSVDCEEILPKTKRVPPNCSCQEVEEQILIMAKTAYHSIRRRDGTPASFEQFRKELQQTNQIIKDTMEIMHTLKILCNHGDMTDVSYGSVKFTLRCFSADKLNSLWDMYRSGKLLNIFQRGFVTRTLLKSCGAEDIKLRVRLAEEEYRQCLREFETCDGLEGPPQKMFISSHDRHLRSSCKTTENRLTGKPLYSVQNCPPRSAFREIQKNQGQNLTPKSTVTQCETVSPYLKDRVALSRRLRSAVPQS